MMTEKKKNKDWLHVSEKFYSIQGEGQTIGIPAVFLRLTGCNLDCTWCDSVEVWKKGNKEKFEHILGLEFVQRLRGGAHLVITGGEPMLQQLRICDFLEWFFDTHGFAPVVEIETNGTIMPNNAMKNHVNFWNVSPKLDNSKERKDDRIKDTVLTELNKQENVIFKFVISEGPKDIPELLAEFEMIDFRKVLLMPAGSSKEELSKTAVMVAETCKMLGIRYSPRIHIDIWDKKTGV